MRWIFRFASLALVLFSTLIIAETPTLNLPWPDNPKENQYTDSLNILTDHLKNHISIVTPTGDSVIAGNSLKVVVKNDFMTPILINGKEWSYTQKGKLEAEIPIEKLGKQTVYITLVLPEGKAVTVRRKVTRLGADTNAAENKIWSSKYIYNPLQQKTLKTLVTRADMAYLLSQLNVPSSADKTNQQHFKNNPKNKSKLPMTGDESHWARQAIDQAVKNNWMAIYPDGSFKPEVPLSVSGYLVSITSFMGYPLQQYYTKSMPLKGVKDNEWTTKFIKAAYYNQLIPSQNTSLVLDRALSYEDWLPYLALIPEIKEAMKAVSSDEAMAQAETEQMTQIDQLTSQILDQFKSKAPQISLTTPVDNTVVFDPKITVSGTIRPAQAFKLNGAYVFPDTAGNFDTIVASEQLKNTYTIETAAGKQTRTVYMLQPMVYKDTQDHWVKQNAATLRFLKITEDTPQFEPEAASTKSYLAGVVARAFNLSANPNETSAQDITGKTPNSNALAAMVKYGILSVDSNSRINPNQVVTRAAGITALVRAIELNPSRIKSENKGPVTFEDLAKNHWAYTSVQKAVDMGLLANGKTFNPNAPLTHAELATLIAKALNVEQVVSLQ